jgi:hypothetical protein
LTRRSISLLPGIGTCSAALMVLMYGVVAVNGTRMPCVRARLRSA